jgi:hypothetical protein
MVGLAAIFAYFFLWYACLHPCDTGLLCHIYILLRGGNLIIINTL